MTKMALQLKAMVQLHANAKEREYAVSRELSPNLDEAVESSLTKSSSDEVKSAPR